MAKRVPLFTKTKEQKRLFQAKIDKDLLDRADAITDALKNIDPDLEFNKTRIVENALREAIQAAELEIKKMKGEQEQHDKKKEKLSQNEIQTT